MTDTACMAVTLRLRAAARNISSSGSWATPTSSAPRECSETLASRKARGYASSIQRSLHVPLHHHAHPYLLFVQDSVAALTVRCTSRFLTRIHVIQGNTISGVDNGDVYVWSSGTVSAKYEGAHKSEVLGMLFVDGVGLFTCGKGGMLKVSFILCSAGPYLI